jgi:predicted TIM-barrel fold metal-dependent hydrolase
MTPLAADCHAHIFGTGHPFAPDLVYTPHLSQCGTALQFGAVLAAHGFTHGLLVAAQPYMYDNTCLLQAIAASERRFKGIALVRAGASEAELRALAEGGIVGLRFNLSSFGTREFTEPGVDLLLAQATEFGWFLQIHCEHDELAAVMPQLRGLKLRIMIDHFGRPDPALGLAQPGFAALLELGRSGAHVVKLSGPFRSSREGYPYHDIDPYIAACLEAFTPARCVWGSDWPFVRVEERIDYGPPLSCLARWLPDEVDRRRVLWETPANLFGFV